MLPKWDDSYSVHNAKVDAQHKELFRLAAEMEAIFDRPTSRAKVKELLTGFFNYMKIHFDDEERYMEEIGYPDLDHHKRAHGEIIASMIRLIKSIKTTNDLKERLYIVAKSWLLEHILYEDMKVAKFRNEGLQGDEIFDFEDFGGKDEELVSYYYTCKCIGKIHDLPLKIHNKLQEGGSLQCKNCKTNIQFYKLS